MAHGEIRRALGFAKSYGRNADAFVDLAYELPIRPDTGLVLALTRFDEYIRRQPTSAVQLLQTFAKVAWSHLVENRRLLILVQSDDPRIEIPLVGARRPSWNDRETERWE
jgi:hypothetical protein